MYVHRKSLLSCDRKKRFVAGHLRPCLIQKEREKMGEADRRKKTTSLRKSKAEVARLNPHGTAFTKPSSLVPTRIFFRFPFLIQGKQLRHVQ